MHVWLCRYYNIFFFLRIVLGNQIAEDEEEAVTMGHIDDSRMMLGDQIAEDKEEAVAIL